jgi:hypothetical protein
MTALPDTPSTGPDADTDTEPVAPVPPVPPVPPLPMVPPTAGAEPLGQGTPVSDGTLIAGTASASVFAPAPGPPSTAPVFTAAGSVSTSLEVTCPGCGTVAHLAELRKTAEEFCRRCDYPLFWARRRTASGVDGPGGEGLRRLPGAGGWRSEASVGCPTCREPNRLDARVCVRCGGDMRPAPPPVAIPAPPPVIVRAPEPEPEPKTTPWWLVILVLVLVAAAVTAAIVLWA